MHMGCVFMRAITFNGDISKWDVSSVNDMTGMFYYEVVFNGDISKWDVSSVNGMIVWLAVCLYGWLGIYLLD